MKKLNTTQQVIEAPNEKFKTINISIFVVLFIISILLRSPFFAEPFGKHHEWLTAVTLRTMEIYDQQGIVNSGFAILTTYPNGANRYIQNNSTIPDKNGNMYYISYPSFFVVFPYLVFKALGISIGQLQIIFFGIFLHLISCIFVYLIISLLTLRQQKINMPSLIGVFVMLFTASTLWFTSSVYFADTLIQPIIISATYFLLKIIKNERSENSKYYIGIIAVLSLLGGLTDWLMYVWAVVVCLYCVKNYKLPNMLKCIITIILSLTASLSLYIIQLATVVKKDEALKWIIAKFNQRTGYQGGRVLQLSLEGWGNLFNNFELNYSIYIFIASIALILMLIIWNIKIFPEKIKIFKFFKKNIEENNQMYVKLEKSAIFLSLLPVLVHLIVLFDFSVIHDFATLKFSFPLSIICALTYHMFHIMASRDRNASIALKFFCAVIVFASIFSVISYYGLNFRISDPSYKEIGEYVKNTAKSDEVVFFSDALDIVPCPQLVYYSKRNIALLRSKISPSKLKDTTKEGTIVNLDGAKTLIKMNNARRGIVYRFNPINRDIGISYIYP